MTRPQGDAQLVHTLKALSARKQAADPGTPVLDLEMLKQLRELGYFE